MNRLKQMIIKILGDRGLAVLWIIKSFFMLNKYKEYKNIKKIIYMLSPSHGNMGDQAISFASIKFLKDKFNEYEIIELERNEIFKYYFQIKRIINHDDLIVLHGGGNMGNLYLQEENPRRFIIKNFKNNVLLSMTQTISFTQDSDGVCELEKMKKIYNSHDKMILLARENKSYERMKEIFKHNIIKVPDIVFYIEDLFNYDDNKRKGIVTCLRADKESIWKEKKNVFLKKLCDKNEVFLYDTAVNGTITNDIRSTELKKMWDVFGGCKVVVTDRLHGMIFAVITKTPCVVLKSLDHKVVESYNWIKHLNYIKYVNDLDYEKIQPIINELIDLETKDKLDFDKKYFDCLPQKIKSIIKKYSEEK